MAPFFSMSAGPSLSLFSPTDSWCHVIKKAPESCFLSFKSHNTKTSMSLSSLPMKTVLTSRLGSHAQPWTYQWARQTRRLNWLGPDQTPTSVARGLGKKLWLAAPFQSHDQSGRGAVPQRDRMVPNRQNNRCPSTCHSQLQALVASQLASPIRFCSSSAQIISAQQLDISLRRRVLRLSWQFALNKYPINGTGDFTVT